MSDVATFQAEQVADRAAFERLIVAQCRPAVVRGLGGKWPLTRAGLASPDKAAAYLVAIDAGQNAEIFVGDRAIAGRYYYGEELAGFNFTRETCSFADALARIVATAAEPASPSLYVGSLPTDAYLPDFATDNPLTIVPPLARPRIWIGHASVVACHHDNSDNLACVAAGRRRFTLFPPGAIGDLYVGPIDHTMAGQPISLAVGSAPEDPRFARFEAIRERALVIELEPGDAVYVPKLWWHQVEALDPFNILVNYWWDATGTGPDAPYSTMLLAMAAIAERPAEERAAWRAFFDHYVFRPQGHPLAHLPSERHGILGPGNAGKIRAMAMRLLRGS
jgi:hypothetical protein